MSEPEPAGSKPGIDRFLVASAFDAELRRRLVESPEQAFQGFDLTEEEKDLLRRPDHRLLPLLGAALARDRDSPVETQASTAAPQPHAVIRARTLPDISLALTLVPCAQYENGRLHAIAYAAWVNPLPQGADPASLPPPEGAALPGQPLAPLCAVISVCAVQTEDAAGGPQVNLSASFRQSSNVTAPPWPEAAGRPDGPPFGSDLASESVRAAVTAVRSAPSGDRYGKLIDLLHALGGGVKR